MNPKETARRVVDQMMSKDYFSQWLAIERIEEGPGFSKLKMTIRKEMLNGFGTAHGGISFSLADSALAFASNSHGQHAVSIDTGIEHIHPLHEGDVIVATAREVHRSKKLGRYRVTVEKEDGTIAALFKGIVYRKSNDWNLSD